MDDDSEKQLRLNKLTQIGKIYVGVQTSKGSKRIQNSSVRRAQKQLKR